MAMTTPLAPMHSRALVVSWRVFAMAAILLACLMTSGPAGAAVDGNEDFALLASEGLRQGVDGVHPEGGPLNTIAWSMAWFQGHLFVGLAQYSLDALVNPGFTALTGQIWRYTPGGAGGIAGTWKLVYEARNVFGTRTEAGYRWMTVCDVGDGVKRLYVVGYGVLRGRVLYTEDGSAFREASSSGLRSSDNGYRPLVCFTTPSGKRLLVTSPVGTLTGRPSPADVSDNPIVLATDNPLTGSWHPYSPLRFGNPDARVIFTIIGFHSDADGDADALYAGVGDPINGLQVWKTSGCDPFPTCVPSWTKVVDRGAGRPPITQGQASNAGVVHMAQHAGAVYASVGGGGTVSFADPTAQDLPTGELLRINQDDTWELIMGQPRLKAVMQAEHPKFVCQAGDPDGAGPLGPADGCVPVSNRGPGFGGGAPDYEDGPAFVVWQLLTGPDGRLYAGTMEDFLVRSTGFDLLATADAGITWTPVTFDGFGDPDQGGVRTLAATPIGLFVGSSSQNGCKIWLGTCDPALAGAAPIADARVVMKLTSPGQVLFDGGRFVALDDEAAPSSGNAKVAASLYSASAATAFCGPDLGHKWDAGDLTGTCGSLPGSLGTAETLPLTLCTGPGNFADCPGLSPSFVGGDFADYTFTLQVTDGEGNSRCDAVVVRAKFLAALAGPPVAPASVSVASLGRRMLRVGWTDVAGETRYEVKQCRKVFSLQCIFSTILASDLPADTSTFDRTVPLPGTYSHSVRACNEHGCSLWKPGNDIRVR